jgi:hypothetical protein
MLADYTPLLLNPLLRTVSSSWSSCSTNRRRNTTQLVRYSVDLQFSVFLLMTCCKYFVICSTVNFRRLFVTETRSIVSFHICRILFWQIFTFKFFIIVFISCRILFWYILALNVFVTLRYNTVAGYCEQDSKLSDSIRGGQFLGEVSA